MASLATFAIFGQTTQGLISGRLLDSRSGRAIAGAHVGCSEESTGVKADGVSDDNGFYVLPLLPPGSYSIRVTALNYQSQEAQELELAVAGRLELNFLHAPAQRCLGSGPVSQRFSARFRNHRHLLRARCRPQSLGQLRRR